MAAVTLDSNSFFALVGSVNAGSNTVFHHTCSGTDRLLVVSVVTTSAGAATDPSYVYYNNVAMTFANTVSFGTSIYNRTYYLMNPSTGNNAVIVRWAASTTRGGIVAASFNNVTQGTVPPFLQLAANTSSSQTLSSYNGYKVYDVIAVSSGDTATANVGNNQTQLSNFVGSTGAGGNAARIASSVEDANSSSTTMSWTTSGGSVIHTSVSIISTDPILLNLSSNTIYSNSSNVVLTGISLDTGAFAKLVYANQEILMVDYVANSTQPYFTSPSLANVFASRIQFTDSANLQILNAQSGIVATKIVSFQPPTTKTVHNVTDISEAGNTGSIYYGQSPAITVNDQIVFDSKSSLTYNVSLDSQGYITIDSLNTDANDSFTYRVYESSAQFWGDEGTITFIGESGAAPYFSKKIKMYIRVVSDAFQETFESYSTITDAINGPWDSQDTALGGTHAITTFDGSKRYACTWTQNESRTLLYYRFPGAVNGDDSTGKSYVKLEWDEYRDANWDFQADKSCRFVGRLGNGNVTLDILLGLEGSGTPGNSTRAVVFGQGLANGSTFIVDTDWNMNREQWYRIAVEIQLNTVGNSDGWIKLWRDGVLMGSTSNTNLRLGSNTYTFHQVAVGGWESGGAPAASETRYIDNVTITYL